MNKKYIYIAGFIILAFLLSVLPISSSRAASAVYVSKTADTNGTCISGTDCSLREAIALAGTGGYANTILFNAGLSGKIITLSSSLTINKNLTIDASKLSSRVIISGAYSYRVFYIDSASTVEFKNLTITNGQIIDGSGGGIYNASSSALTLTDCGVINSTAFASTTASFGGGIYNLGTLTISNSKVSGNSTGGATTYHGGGLYSSGPITISNSTFTNNSAAQGGGFYGNGNNISITNTTFFNNTASGGAGIFLASGTMTVIDSTFDNNYTTGTNHNGGGVFNSAVATIKNSTFTNNSATGSGGGILNSGTLTVVNNTFSNNEAYYHGGGIYSPDTDSALTVVNSTFSGNAATNGRGGALYVSPNSIAIHLKNSILANSVASEDCFNQNGGPDSSTFQNNLIENNASSPDACGTPSLTADPMLASLADNGGPTETMALLTGSPAIDAGDNTVCEDVLVGNLDQRGATRPQGTDCDLGAYESYANDEFEFAVEITALNYLDMMNTGVATPDPSDPELPSECTVNGSGQATVWYKYKPASNGAISVDTQGTDYDSFIAIWEGTDINNLLFVACNNDTGGTKQSAVGVQVIGGKTYYIEIGQP